MRRLIFILLSVLLYGNAGAQVENPIKWSTQAKKTGTNEYDLVFTATLEKGWHVYSQYIKEGGPIPTTFTFNNGSYTRVGKVEEKGHAEKVYDQGFEMDLVYFSGTSDFVQHVKLTGPASKITGTFEYMICNDEMCLPPVAIDFSFPVEYEKPEKK